MKTAIYVRVSTEEQAREGYSISGQLKKLKAFCVSQEWEIADVYSDEGISAKNMERPELQRMLKDIEKGKVECVLVYRLDRLTRSVLDLYNMLDVFERHNCKFKSATEVYDTTTAMGRMFITIVAALAQWERENMGERIAFGFTEKVRQGKYPLNFAPIGYDLNKKESKLYINEKEASTVRLIYKKYIDGLGSNKLCKFLNDKNIRTKHGNKWSSDTIFRVLKSPIPAGGVSWNGKIYWGLHEAIVPKETWLEVQRIKDIRLTKPPGAVSSSYIFSGLIKCPGCKRNLTGSQTFYRNKKGEKITYRFYRCKASVDGRCKKDTISVMEPKLEDAFIQSLTSWDFTKEISSVAKEGILEKSKVKIDVEKLKSELDKIERRKKKWQYAWADGFMEESDFKERMKEANNEKRRIQEQLDSILGEEEKPINENEIEEALNEIKKNWDHLKKLEKKNLLQEIIKEIHIKKEDGQIKITAIDFL